MSLFHFAFSPKFRRGERCVDAGTDRFRVLGGRRGKDEIKDLLRQPERARMPDAEAQTPEVIDFRPL